MRASVTSCSARFCGFTTLLFTLMILVSLIGFSYISASTSAAHQRVLTQYKISNSAFNAAQAGLDYGIPYLTSHYSTITNGTQVSFTNGDGSSTNVHFDFMGNKDLIRITSTGLTPDGSSRTVEQLAKYKTDSGNASMSFALQSQGGVVMKNNAIVSDLSGSAQTIRSGGDVSLSNNAKTILNTGVASVGPSNIGSDIVANDFSFASVSDTDLFLNFLKSPFVNFQSATTTMNFAPKTGNYTYSNLTNINGTAIGVNHSSGLGKIGYNAKLGNASSPVTLVITLNGNASFQISNNAIIYGKIITSKGSILLDNNTHLYGDLVVDGNVTLGNNVIVDGDVITTGNLLLNNNAQINGVGFALGNVDLINNAIVNGAVLAGGNLVNLKENAKITYNPTNAQVTQPGGGATTGSYGKVSGSWTDLSS